MSPQGKIVTGSACIGRESLLQATSDFAKDAKVTAPTNTHAKYVWQQKTNQRFIHRCSKIEVRQTGVFTVSNVPDLHAQMRAAKLVESAETKRAEKSSAPKPLSRSAQN